MITLQRIRKELGLNQTELGQILGVSFTTVSRSETSGSWEPKSPIATLMALRNHEVAWNRFRNHVFDEGVMLSTAVFQALHALSMHVGISNALHMFNNGVAAKLGTVLSEMAA